MKTKFILIFTIISAVFTCSLNAKLNSNNLKLPIKVNLAHIADDKEHNPRSYIIIENNIVSNDFVSDIKLHLTFNDIIFASYSISELHNQNIAIPTLLPKSNGECLLKLTYVWKGKSFSITKDFSLLVVKKKNILNVTSFIPLITSIIGIFIGGLLTHYLLKRRERIKSNFEWKKMIFEKYEKDYREFLSEWNGDQSSILLKEKFDSLRKNAIIPSSILIAYDETYRILTDNSSKEKKSACQKLMDDINIYIHNPYQ